MKRVRRGPWWCVAALLAACSAAPPMPDPPPGHPAAANAEAAPREAPSTTLQLPAAEAKQ